MLIISATSKGYLKRQYNYSDRMQAKLISSVISFALILPLVACVMTNASAVSLISSSTITSMASGTLHNQTLEEIVKPATLGHDPELGIGINPVHMAIYSEHSTGIASGTNPPPKMYVATESDFITVISVENNTKIKDIKVGREPSFVAIPVFTGLVYVANKFNDSISVISVQNNTKIKDIPVGKGPNSIADTSGKVYVANTGSNTVSVISVQNNTKIKDIPVGNWPIFVANYVEGKTIYVANAGSDGISVIDDVTDKVAAKIIFN